MPEVYIEIPKGNNVKYEHNHNSNKLTVDRFLQSAYIYPGNYGYIPHTLSPDGDPLDCLVMCDYSLFPTAYIDCRIIGAILTEDEKGGDDKIIAYPNSCIDPENSHINDITDMNPMLLNKITNFFENYKNLEKGKFVKVKKIANAEEAQKIYEQSILNYNCNLSNTNSINTTH